MPCMFPLREEPESFLETAPWIFRSELELDVSAETCFQILLDDNAWSIWHPEVTNIQWQTPKPVQKGSVRTVLYKDWLSYLLLGGPITMEEKYDTFDGGGATKKFAVSFTAISRPSFMVYKACREEFKVEECSGGCKFTRTVAIDPAFLPRYVFGCLTYNTLKNTFTKKCPGRFEKAVLERRIPITE